MRFGSLPSDSLAISAPTSKCVSRRDIENFIVEIRHGQINFNPEIKDMLKWDKVGGDCVASHLRLKEQIRKRTKFKRSQMDDPDSAVDMPYL